MLTQKPAGRQYNRPSVLYPIVARCFKPPKRRDNPPRTTVAPLEARRAASKRLPPLSCGCRDPWVHVCGRHQ